MSHLPVGRDCPNHGRTRGGIAATLILAALACLFAFGLQVSSAYAETATYSATETVPVPPASKFEGSGGGDGWAVALSSTAVYNVFHHQESMTVACHLQANAEPCYTPETVKDAEGHDFATSGHPGMYLDQSTGKLYVFGTRTSDETAGVVCFDTTLAPTNPDPFCGFTELTPVGQAPRPDDISGASAPMLIGSHLYSFNFVDAVTPGNGEDQLMCFDVSTDAACAGQPYAVNVGAGTVEDGGFPSPATAAIGTKVIVPIDIEGTSRLACFDDATGSSCGGSWPVSLSSDYASINGAPYPLLDATGKLTGLCIPTGTDECFNLEGGSVATPAGMPEVISASDGWNGPAFVLGPRIYVPNGTIGEGAVECYDYSTGTGCANFPKSFEGLDYLYTVNADPQRPECIWVNADGGEHQIQNFDAYSGKECGQGAIRVLANQFVVPAPQCTPASYVSLQVIKPARNAYTSGSVAFDDGDGNSIGLAPVALDANGVASLAGLNLNTATGLPQFLFTLNTTSAIGAVEVKLTWQGDYSATCVGKGVTVVKETKKEEPKGGVAAFKAAHLASTAGACIASNSYLASVSGTPIASVTFLVNGHKVAKLTKANSHGKFTARIKLTAGKKEKLVVHVVYKNSTSSTKVATLRRTLAKCAVHHAKPRFTG